MMRNHNGLAGTLTIVVMLDGSRKLGIYNVTKVKSSCDLFSIIQRNSMNFQKYDLFIDQ